MPTFGTSPETEAQIAARDDVVAGMAPWFDVSTGEFGLRDDLHRTGAIANDDVTAVAWRYVAAPLESAWGVAARRGPIRVHGVTFVHGGEAAPTFSRYIDWHGVFVQLGVAAAGRVVGGSADHSVS